MIANEAFELLVKTNYKTKLMKCRSCLDFGTFYLFCVAPIYIKDDEEYLTGTVFDCVDKRTGRIFEYDITSDIDAYERAKDVSVDTFWNTPLSKISISD